MQPVCDDFFKEIAGEAVPNSLALNPPVRAYLAAVQDYLIGHHQAGVAASRINAEHAQLMDRLLRKLFRLAEDAYFETFPKLNYRIALIAVGGYGRRELSLASDIDLLFLHRGKTNPYVETIAEAITHRLWDARQTVGAATRNLAECLRIGREDLSTLTSYLDAHFLIGDPELFAEFEGEVRNWIRGDAEKFVRAKLEEQKARHLRFGESLYLLQPNLRESVGGLRDYHTALWVARALHWGVRGVRDLLVHGFIDEQQQQDLSQALEFLWAARNDLHRGGRKDDRLHYQAQERLASSLHFESALDLTPVERLMQRYYVHARTVERVTRHVVEHTLATLERRRGRRQSAPLSVAEGFLIAENQLEIPSETLLRERPARMLSAFAVAQHHDVDLSARAQRWIRQNLELVDDAFRADPEISDLFRRILGSPLRVYRSLKLMDEIGLLAAYLPEFRHLVGLWQHDLYHTYTVDVHSLFLVEQLRRIKGGRFRDELPRATELMREVRRPEALFIACILHDIGKGRGGGHSEKGAQQIPDICRRLGIGEEETQMVQFLVRHHLTMSAMAEQRNVDDPRVILRLANLAQSREALRNLYLLTVADIRSVSREAWTTWKAGLLESLYRNAAEWFEAGEDHAAADRFFLERASERVAARQKEVLAALAADGIEEVRATGFLDTMPRRYLLDHATADIVLQVRAGLSFTEQNRPVEAYSCSSQGAPFWGLVVFAPDRHGLFSIVAGSIASLGHNILGAQVYTSRASLAMEIFQIEPIAGEDEEEQHERARIEERVRAVLAGEAKITPRRTPSSAALAARPKPPEVSFANEDSDFYTIIDVHANDRPGLLYDITRTLAEYDLNVVMARVATRASRVTDAFYVTQDGKKIVEPERQAAIRQALLEAVRAPRP